MSNPEPFVIVDWPLSSRTMRRRICCDASPKNVSEACCSPPNGFPRVALAEEQNPRRSRRLKPTRDLEFVRKPNDGDSYLVQESSSHTGHGWGVKNKWPREGP
jgi:hypothetical protein